MTTNQTVDRALELGAREAPAPSAQAREAAGASRVAAVASEAGATPALGNLAGQEAAPRAWTAEQYPQPIYPN